MSHVRQQRMSKVQFIVVISENIFQPRTMNFAVGTFLCDLLDFSQFTVDSSENNTENN